MTPFDQFLVFMMMTLLASWFAILYTALTCDLSDYHSETFDE